MQHETATAREAGGGGVGGLRDGVYGRDGLRQRGRDDAMVSQITHAITRFFTLSFLQTVPVRPCYKDNGGSKATSRIRLRTRAVERVVKNNQSTFLFLSTFPSIEVCNLYRIKCQHDDATI